MDFRKNPGFSTVEGAVPRSRVLFALNAWFARKHA